MEDWTRVVLYGTYDGFVRSTVDPLQIAVRLDGGERVEIPSECVISTDQIVKKDEIKLRDVIKRIEGLNLGTQKVWLDEILNELGSDYGTLKYKDGYGQGKLEGEWVGQQLKDADKIRQELNKPVIPQFVADWIEYAKNEEGYNVVGAVTEAPEGRIGDWLILDNVNTFARAWLDGYTVEKEKRYRVKIKNAYYNKCPQFLCETDNGIFWAAAIDLRKTKFTRKELEQAGFGEVFDSPLFEVEEVE